MKKTNRQIVLDTETTGMPASQGHRIIEIGCIEMIDRNLSGKTYHQYINPQRDIDKAAYNVHGISSDFLADKPIMADCIDKFLDFICGANLIIHNAAFDVEFLDYELGLLNKKERIADICSITDTLALARKKNPGARANLDALAKRYNVTQFSRDLHGALLDSKILARIYLAMTGGQSGLVFNDNKSPNQAKKLLLKKNISIADVFVSKKEKEQHQLFFKN